MANNQPSNATQPVKGASDEVKASQSKLIEKMTPSPLSTATSDDGGESSPSKQLQLEQKQSKQPGNLQTLDALDEIGELRRQQVGAHTDTVVDAAATTITSPLETEEVTQPKTIAELSQASVFSQASVTSQDSFPSQAPVSSQVPVPSKGSVPAPPPLQMPPTAAKNYQDWFSRCLHCGEDRMNAEHRGKMTGPTCTKKCCHCGQAHDFEKCPASAEFIPRYTVFMKAQNKATRKANKARQAQAKAAKKAADGAAKQAAANNNNNNNNAIGAETSNGNAANNPAEPRIVEVEDDDSSAPQGVPQAAVNNNPTTGAGAETSTANAANILAEPRTVELEDDDSSAPQVAPQQAAVVRASPTSGQNPPASGNHGIQQANTQPRSANQAATGKKKGNTRSKTKNKTSDGAGHRACSESKSKHSKPTGKPANVRLKELHLEIEIMHLKNKIAEQELAMKSENRDERQGRQDGVDEDRYAFDRTRGRSPPRTASPPRYVRTRSPVRHYRPAYPEYEYYDRPPRGRSPPPRPAPQFRRRTPPPYHREVVNRPTHHRGPSDDTYDSRRNSDDKRKVVSNDQVDGDAKMSVANNGIASTTRHPTPAQAAPVNKAGPPIKPYSKAVVQQQYQQHPEWRKVMNMAGEGIFARSTEGDPDDRQYLPPGWVAMVHKDNGGRLFVNQTTWQGTTSADVVCDLYAKIHNSHASPPQEWMD